MSDPRHVAARCSYKRVVGQVSGCRGVRDASVLLVPLPYGDAGDCMGGEGRRSE